MSSVGDALYPAPLYPVPCTLRAIVVGRRCRRRCRQRRGRLWRWWCGWCGWCRCRCQCGLGHIPISAVLIKLQELVTRVRAPIRDVHPSLEAITTSCTAAAHATTSCTAAALAATAAQAAAHAARGLARGTALLARCWYGDALERAEGDERVRGGLDGEGRGRLRQLTCDDSRR